MVMHCISCKGFYIVVGWLLSNFKMADEVVENVVGTSSSGDSEKLDKS